MSILFDELGDIDFHLFEAGEEKVKETVGFLERQPSRKAIIDAGTEGLLNALRRHFAMREREAPKSSGFPWFGKAYPKRYFWRGTRGTSVSEAARVTLSSPARLEGQVSIASPALAHKLAKNPPPIRPTGGRRLLAIPANPVAAQWSGMARDFPGGVRFAFSRLPDGHWLPSLVAAANYKHTYRRGRRKGESTAKFGGGADAGENEVVYWLVHKVKTRRDPSAMPAERVQTNAVESAVRTAISRLLAGQQQK